ncbi:MAG: FAD-binding oxidoreductase [Bacillota bacterium]|nr:FAD-binding oxidoreductase [Bacillota bacterium]
MKKAYEVVVVGGGIVGCSIAFELAKRGWKDILLIERGHLASGATGRCGAGIRQQWGSELNATLAVESTHILEELEEYTGYKGNCGLNQAGYLLIACTEKEWAQFQLNLDVQHKLGINSFPVDLEKEVYKYVSHINTEGIYGATFCQKDGHADPFHCTFAYGYGAKQHGVEIWTYTSVHSLKAEGGKIVGVETDKGFVEAKMVINCANGWAPGLAAQVGDEIPVFPERHQALVTEPVAGMGPNGGPMPMVMSFERKFYVQQTPHGSFVMGIAEVEPVSFNIRSSWQFLEENCGVICATLPALRNLRVVRQWAGLYDMSPDRNPIIEFSKNAEGLLTVCGFSGHGFMVAPRTATLVAKALCNEPDTLDIKRFSADRYRTGELLLEPSVV